MKIIRGVLVGARRAHQKGMTLLEIVVSMLVVALGLAMSISMIQTANRFGDTAEYTAFALQKSQLIIDTMRANVLAKDTYVLEGVNIGNSNDNNAYESIYDSLSSIYAAGSGSALVGKLKCKEATCTKSEENAKADVYAWSDEIIKTLPGGRAFIGKNGNHYVVVVMWRHIPATGSEANIPVQGTRVWFTL